MEPTGNTQERTASPSICTVQAPHCAIPQPNFVPVRPKTSRSTHSKGMSAGTSTDFETPLTFKFVMGIPSIVSQHIAVNRASASQAIPGNFDRRIFRRDSIEGGLADRKVRG